MSFIIKKRRQLPPPPPICLDKDAKDRFGLPVYLPTLLGETSEMRAARISATKRLIQDAVDSAVTQLGRREVRRLINLALKMPPKGKSADRQLNDDLLAAYYREKSAAPDEIKSIPRRIAQEFYKQKETQKKIHSVTKAPKIGADGESGWFNEARVLAGAFWLSRRFGIIRSRRQKNTGPSI